jgi:hypothetical protein
LTLAGFAGPTRYYWRVSSGANGILIQLVVYLRTASYRPDIAANALSLTLSLNTLGMVLFGFADLIGASLLLALSVAIIRERDFYHFPSKVFF